MIHSFISFSLLKDHSEKFIFNLQINVFPTPGLWQLLFLKMEAKRDAVAVCGAGDAVAVRGRGGAGQAHPHARPPGPLPPGLPAKEQCGAGRGTGAGHPTALIHRLTDCLLPHNPPPDTAV